MSVFYYFILTSVFTHGMLVKDWGTGSQMNRLIYSTRDLFQKSFDFLTAGQGGVFPVADLRKNYTQVKANNKGNNQNRYLVVINMIR